MIDSVSLAYRNNNFIILRTTRRTTENSKNTKLLCHWWWHCSLVAITAVVDELSSSFCGDAQQMHLEQPPGYTFTVLPILEGVANCNAYKQRNIYQTWVVQNFCESIGLEQRSLRITVADLPSVDFGKDKRRCFRWASNQENIARHQNDSAYSRSLKLFTQPLSQCRCVSESNR